MSQYQREPACRVFANELMKTDIVLERDAEDPYAPQYVLTPTGAKVNRVFIVGTLVEKEDIGTDAEYWRIRVSDPTGVFFMYTGQYQPDATRAVAEIGSPAFVAVVGKVAPFTNEEGTVRISIKPESISHVDEDTWNIWVLETARLTLERIKLLEDGTSEHQDMLGENHLNNIETYRQMVKKVLDKQGD